MNYSYLVLCLCSGIALVIIGVFALALCKAARLADDVMETDQDVNHAGL